MLSMWSPDQYARFRSERRQPFDDLVALIQPLREMRIADLGCGSGELTRELHNWFGASSTIGVDSSDAMVAQARGHETPSLRFARQSIDSFASDEPFDLIFSNAALHWVPDHEQLLTSVAAQLTARGQLAIQMPANDTHASHRVAAKVARAFGLEARPSPILPLEEYAELLQRLGFAEIHVRLQVYGHHLPSTRDVVEWVRGALLTHYATQLGSDAFAKFVEEYSRELMTELGEKAPYFYTYKRILIHGARGSSATGAEAAQ